MPVTVSRATLSEQSKDLEWSHPQRRLRRKLSDSVPVPSQNVRPKRACHGSEDKRRRSSTRRFAPGSARPDFAHYLLRKVQLEGCSDEVFFGGLDAGAARSENDLPSTRSTQRRNAAQRPTSPSADQPRSRARGVCAICTDERQWVPADGQRCTTLAQLATSGRRTELRGTSVLPDRTMSSANGDLVAAAVVMIAAAGR